MITTVLNVHDDVDCALDTIDSIKKYVGGNILVIVDGVHWKKWEKVNVPAHKMCGFQHGCAKSPYRNVALGIKSAWDLWGSQSKWICYTEYDVLFTSDFFKKNLEAAEEMGVWMLGNDGHIDDKEMPLVESMIKEKFKSYYYLLGCCQFFSCEFMKKLDEIDFFDKFLNLTNQFTQGYMPGYSGCDISEHMYPSLCRHFGGNVGVFASYDEMGQWHGHYRYFPMRWRPNINFETENFEESSIMHPIKDISDPLRVHHRKIRESLKNVI